MKRVKTVGPWSFPVATSVAMLTALLVTLKLAGVLTAPWWLVLSPAWGSAIVAGLLFIASFYGGRS